MFKLESDKTGDNEVRDSNFKIKERNSQCQI